MKHLLHMSKTSVVANMADNKKRGRKASEYLNVRIPQKMAEKLEELEKEGYGSKSDIVRSALLFYFDKIEREKQREKLITEKALHELAEDEELLEEFAEKIKEE